MTERDSDIEFDFFEDLDFEDPEAREPLEPEDRQREPGPPRGGPPRRPPRGSRGVAPILRLAGLIAFAILVVVLLVFVVQSCDGGGKKRSYQRYMEKVTPIAKGSEQIGKELTNVLTTPGLKAIEIEPKIAGFADRSEQLVAQAEALNPPNRLQNEHLEQIEALQFRVDGLNGLAEAFRQGAGSKDVAGASLRLAEQAQRLVTSDIVWDDLFRIPSVAAMQADGVTGVAVPDSNFVQSPDFGSSSYWEPILERVSGAATGGTPTGLHGTGLVSTTALPSNQVLSEGEENTVTAGTDLGFAVTVEDTGDAQEVQIKVTLTIQQQPSPIVATNTIDVINPSEKKTVTFRNLGTVTFATKTTVKVDVKAVPGEKNTDNNSASYPVIFSLG